MRLRDGRWLLGQGWHGGDVRIEDDPSGGARGALGFRLMLDYRGGRHHRGAPLSRLANDAGALAVWNRCVVQRQSLQPNPGMVAYSPQASSPAAH